MLAVILGFLKRFSKLNIKNEVCVFSSNGAYLLPSFSWRPSRPTTRRPRSFSNGSRRSLYSSSYHASSRDAQVNILT